MPTGTGDMMIPNWDITSGIPEQQCHTPSSKGDTIYSLPKLYYRTEKIVSMSLQK